MEKILLLLPGSPLPANTGIRNHNYGMVKILSVHFECDVVGFYTDDREKAEWDQFKQSFPSVSVVGLFQRERGYRRFLKRIKFAMCGLPLALADFDNKEFRSRIRELLDKKYMFVEVLHCLLSDIVRSLPRREPWILYPPDAYSLTYYRSRRLGLFGRNYLRNWYLFRAFSKLELRYSKDFTIVCPVSSVDMEWLKKRCGKITVKVVGIVVDNRFLGVNVAVDPLNQRVLCLGFFGSPAVAKGAIDFLRECWPGIRKECPRSSLLFWGRGPSDFLRKSIVGCDDSDWIEWADNYIATLLSARVIVYPQACGSGVQTKLEQALALGLPVVARNISLSPLKVEVGKHAMGCETPQEFQQAVVTLLNDINFCKTMGERARRLIQQRFTANIVMEDLLTAHHQVRR